VRVLTWNLFHGRSVPDRPCSLLEAFAATLAGWEWDAALLQEVPPWWPAPLAAAAGAQHRAVLTSRNALLPLRRAIAERRPDLIKSNGGGANAILVRGDRPIREHRVWRLRLWPERRFVHAVRADGMPPVANVHASQDSRGRPPADLRRAAAAVAEWAPHGPLILAGDLNQRAPALPGFRHAAGHSVDHVLARGLAPEAPGETLPHGPLSDHAPLAVTLGEGGAGSGRPPYR